MDKLKKLEEIYEEASKNVRMACFDELKKIGKELKALGWDGKPLYPFSKEACREEYKNDIEAALGDISENEDDYENKYAEVFESYWYDYVDGYTVLFMNHDYYSYCGFEFVINEYGRFFARKPLLIVGILTSTTPMIMPTSILT